MKFQTALILTLGVLAPAAAGAYGFDRAAPPLQDLLGRARTAKKPLLLKFSAVW